MYSVVTHDGKFHTDEIFGIAVLRLHFGAEALLVTRTRDESRIAVADIVLDVGGEYDPARWRFDHHQLGAPVRDNGIPYAAFGLVWKEFGEKIAGSKEIADAIDKKLAQAIDAADNGVALYTTNEHELRPVELSAVLESYMPPMGSSGNVDEAFFAAVDVAEAYLVRVIEHRMAKEALMYEAQRVYTLSSDPSVLQFDTPMKRGIFTEYEDVLVIVTPDDEKTKWSAQAVPVSDNSFDSKVLFPLAWRGLRDEELAAVSGIEDARFCHKGGFMFVAGSKEGAIKAAREAR